MRLPIGCRVTQCEFQSLPSNDPRSYRIDSSKLLNTGFTPSYKVDDAIKEVFSALNTKTINDDPRFHTVKWMLQKKIGVQK